MDEVIEYLLQGDPALRWQVLLDLTDADAETVAAERSRVAREGWGARLLAEQAGDGRWDGGVYRPGWVDGSRPMFDAWTATHFALQQLVDLGVDPGDPIVAEAIARVRTQVRWEHADEPYFQGEIEPCVNGVVLTVAAYFGQDGAAVVDTLERTQLRDGGWNCWDEDGTSVSSMHPTICVLEGLRDWERAAGPSDRLAGMRTRAEGYLLDRRLLWRRSTGELVDPRFGMVSYPVRWYYDVLRALEYFRVARVRDERLADAVQLLRGKRLANGLWPLENTHEGPTLFDLEGEFEGFPSRWITLRALRVLRWWDTDAGGVTAG